MCSPSYCCIHSTFFNHVFFFSILDAFAKKQHWLRNCALCTPKQSINFFVENKKVSVDHWHEMLCMWQFGNLVAMSHQLDPISGITKQSTYFVIFFHCLIDVQNETVRFTMWHSFRPSWSVQNPCLHSFHSPIYFQLSIYSCNFTILTQLKE